MKRLTCLTLALLACAACRDMPAEGRVTVGDAAIEHRVGSTVVTATSLNAVNANGSTIPVGGTMTAGNALVATGASSWDAGPINLAGGSAYVAGALPLANLALGTAAQTLIMNAGATAPAWVSKSGDITTTAAGVETVNSISGTNPIMIKPGGTNALQIGAWTAVSSWGALYGSSVVPGTNNAGLLIASDDSQAYLNATSVYLSVADNVIVSAVAAGAAITGTLSVSSATTLSGALVLASPQTIACSTGGSFNVAATPTPGIIVTSGTLSSNCTIAFATNASTGLYQLDMSGVTLGATFGVVFTNGTATKTYVSSSVLSGTLATVWTHGTNTLAVNF